MITLFIPSMYQLILEQRIQKDFIGERTFIQSKQAVTLDTKQVFIK